MWVRKDIVPFYFPCGRCSQYTFHYVCEQPYGLTINIPFIRRPLASTHTGFHVVCNKCTVINGRLDRSDVTSLVACILPKSICQTYPSIQQFYNPALFDHWRGRHCEMLDEELAQLANSWLSNYRLEI